VAEDDGRIVGHLYGALLEDETYGQGVWVGPDGASFNDVDVLGDLYETAGAAWIDSGALEHYVWTLDDNSTTDGWHEMGFARMHRRGVAALPRPLTHRFPDGYALRRGGVDDFELAVALDDELAAAQRLGPSFSTAPQSSSREDLAETLADSETHHYVVERSGVAVAQCITFPLPTRRGSFDASLHLSAVTVRPEHRHRGVATAMVDRAFTDAVDAGFTHAETNWRVTHRRAQRFWTAYGFEATYVRLHRTIGAG
jgi:GNAT superfamily N-acetyltransferase